VDHIADIAAAQESFIRELASQGNAERSKLREYAQRNPAIAPIVDRALATTPAPKTAHVEPKRPDNGAIMSHPGLGALASRTGHLQGFRVWAIGRAASDGRGWITRRALGRVALRYGISSEMVRRGLQDGAETFFARHKGRIYLAAPDKAYVALYDGHGLPTLGTYRVAIEAAAWRSLPKLRRALFVGSLANEVTGSQETLATQWGVSLAQITRWTYRRKDVQRQTNFEVATGKVPDHWKGRNYWEPRSGLFVRRLPNTYRATALEVKVRGTRLRKQNKAIRGAVGRGARIFGTGEQRLGLSDRIFFPTVAAAVRAKRRRGLSPGAVIAEVDKVLETLARQHIFGRSARLWQGACA